MPKVMIRRGSDGALSFYVAKKDLEETVVSLEHDGPDKWGGEVELADGSRYLLDLLDEMPRLPVTLRAKRL
ncbi:MAG: putative nitrogen fixation protein NifT [Methylohalobius sp. ZOD2]|nr:putative nitrogen fixation protein NifT [Methylothermaceae bacterium]